MLILVLNCGSTTLKYQLINMETESVLAKGNCERIGIEGAFLTHKVGDKKEIITTPMPNHKVAAELVFNSLVNPEYGAIPSLSEISAIGHRVVHGGEKFSSSVLITPEVIEQIKECSDLAPLHNPANIIGIEACQELLPNVPNVAVFDTAFHQTMPEEAYIYPIPYEYYEKYGIRRYGFHGTSHKYVSQRAAEILGRSDLKLVTCHLGGGSSIAAIKNGKSIDTTMGLTPLDGIPMGTRSGSIDPAIIEYIMNKENLSIGEVLTILNKKSGVLGISNGASSDFRDLRERKGQGDKLCTLALATFAYRVRKVIGEYMAALNGLDAIVFTAGIGENSDPMRKEIMEGLDGLGIFIDETLNVDAINHEYSIISTPESKVKVIVIKTNEELMIARDTLALVK